MAGETRGRGVRTPPGGRNKREVGGRSHVCKVMLNDDELRIVKGRAAALGISMQRAMIEATMGVPPLTRTERDTLHRELMAVRRQLAGLTNNVNQIAKALNSDGEVPAPQIRAVLDRSARAAERVEQLAMEYRTS